MAKLENLTVKFGGKVSSDQDKASIGVTLDRGAVNADEAIDVLCGARVTATLECDPLGAKDAAGQTTIANTKVDIHAVAEVSALSVKPDTIGLTLQFETADVRADKLAVFAKREGRFWATRLGDSGKGTSDGE